jgi:hypothetical protein
MRIHCYDSHADQHTYEQLWQLIQRSGSGWISDRIIYMRFWIPSQCVPFALLIDSTLTPVPSEDWIA